MVSAFTLLSLITGSRGQITGAWIDLLQQFVGMGVWGLPVVAGTLGLWIVIRAVERMPDLPWQRPTGFLLIFIGYIIGSVLMTRCCPRSCGGLARCAANDGPNRFSWELGGMGDRFHPGHPRCHHAHRSVPR